MPSLKKGDVEILYLTSNEVKNIILERDTEQESLGLGARTKISFSHISKVLFVDLSLEEVREQLNIE